MRTSTDPKIRSGLEKEQSLSERDADVIWHPFTQMQTAGTAIPIVRGQGAYLFAEDGTAYLDAISSWWVNLHGHAHPYIARKISEQAHSLEHTMLAGLTHSPAIELAERLTQLTGMDKLFYSDNGSTAVEAALKMALQFWHNRDPHTRRKKFLSLRGSYHGDTFGAMSAAGKNVFNRPFWDHLFPVISVDLSCLANLPTEEIAAFIFEPLVLGAGGMQTHSPQALDAAIRFCRQHGILTIADEVMTGFGRLETLFACELLTQSPDMMCLSKGITGGFLPLGATLCTQKIYDAFLSPSLADAFLHGHSYSGNPLACVAALASLDLLLSEQCHFQREMIAASHRVFCRKHLGHPRLKRCESLGTLLIVEMHAADDGYFSKERNTLSTHFLQKGILMRPLGNVLSVMPPYCIRPEELDLIYQAIEEIL